MTSPAGDFPLAVDQTLPIGPHTLRVVYNDTFGQTAEETFPFDIDRKYCHEMRVAEIVIVHPI